MIKYIVHAKRWFDRTAGNTYHTVVVEDTNNKEVYRSGFVYGYGDQWRFTAIQGLIDLGLLDKKDMHNHELIRATFNMNVADVTRKKDLDI